MNNVETRRFLWVLQAAAIFVMLLACANVANLQLVRAADRQKEIGIRVAIGGTRFRVLRTTLTEAFLIACMGGVGAILLGYVVLEDSKLSIPPIIYRYVAGLRQMHMDRDTVLFTIAASLFAGFVCAIPAMYHNWHSLQRSDLALALKGDGSGVIGSARSKLRTVILVTEIAMAMVLLVGAAVMVEAFNRMTRMNPGYNSANLLTMEVSLPEKNYSSPALRSAYYSNVLDNIRAVPEVSAAGAAASMGYPDGVFVEGRPHPRPGEPMPDLRAVTSGYFASMQIPLFDGRAIDEQDTSTSTPTVLVSESIARHYWPNQNPIGRRIRLWNSQAEWLTVVGVCGDLKDWFRGNVMPAVYVAQTQYPQASMRIVARTSGDPLRVAKPAVAAAMSVDRNQPVYDVKSMDQVMAEQSSGVRSSARAMVRYALIAFVLAVTGIYSVTAYLVSQRTFEIGIRTALGASRGVILSSFLVQAAKLAGAGLAIGLVFSIIMTRIASAVLFNVVGLSAAVMALAFIALGASALLAAYIPARRATQVDPVIALRAQ